MRGSEVVEKDWWRSAAFGLVGVRAAVGVAALVAPGIAARAMGFPADADTATARLLARIFGLREVAVAGLTFTVLRRGDLGRDLMAWNAAIDGSDAVIAAVALGRRRGIDRAAVGTIALALPLSAAWLWLRSRAPLP